ncbi:hypothetical protein GBAR_LOCUS14188, partial [Geodia barretti]
MWIYLVVTLLLATETVANNVNENLASIPYETIQLPALYGCKNGTKMCIWPPCRSGPYNIINVLKGNGTNWVLFASMDLEDPALLFVHKAVNGAMIYCSSHYDEPRITCSTDDTETI